MNDILFIFGGKSTAIEIGEIANSEYDFEQIYYIINEEKINKNHIYEKELQDFCKRIKKQKNLFYIISMSNIRVRLKCIQLAKKILLKPCSIISSSAYISPTAQIGDGVYIAPNTSISSNALLKGNSIINYNVIIGHDTIIRENCIFNPGCSIGGNVTIGKNVLIGSNAFIFQGKTLGDDTQVDALTYVFKDIPENRICSNRSIKIFKRII